MLLSSIDAGCVLFIATISNAKKVILFVHTKLALIAAIALIVLSGCAKNYITGGYPYSDGSQSNLASALLTRYELIAIDLVNAMVQIDDLHPTNLSNIKVDAPQGSFGGALANVLESAGYNVRQLGGGYADLKWSITPADIQKEAAEEPRPELFSIVVNNANLSRNYQFDSRRVKPTSNLMVSGVANIPTKLHDELFDQDVLPSVKRPSPQTRRDTANAALGGSIRNVFEIGGSNYQDKISLYKNVGAMVVNFSDGSAKLSKPSHIKMRRFLNSVSRGSDAVWVIGCSIGSTRYKGGNEKLARLRTKAVVDWLKSSGMNAERLFAESCWAEQPRRQNMPKRGVQLNLLRERKN